MSTTQPAAPMSTDQARIFYIARAEYVKRMSKLTRPVLAGLYDLELADRQMTHVFGGPDTKDEILTALIHLCYPVAKLNEATHALYHAPEYPNEVCAWCNPNPCTVCGAIDVCEYTPGLGPLINGRHANG